MVLNTDKPEVDVERIQDQLRAPLLQFDPDAVPSHTRTMDVFEEDANDDRFIRRADIDRDNGEPEPFSGSPSIDEESNLSAPTTPWYINAIQITAMVSNFSTSYNAVNISMVVPILQQLYATNTEVRLNKDVEVILV